MAKDRYKRPEHWLASDWEAKARENPLLAIMTVEEMAAAPSREFSPELTAEFFERGRRLYERELKPHLQQVDPTSLVVEYGCGAGRIMNALIEDGRRCAGIDISPTMLELCRSLTPKAETVWLLDEHGRCEAPDASAGFVYSYSVLQHIQSLSAYTTALDEICRILAPGAVAALQVNCEDFKDGPDCGYRTENFETHSLHFRPTKTGPYKRHEQDQWSGVYIGYQVLSDLLAERGVTVEAWRYHTPDKPRAIWVTARKG